MKLIIDIPNYNLKEVQNGSIACGQILKAVKNGKPYDEEITNNDIQQAIKEGFANGYEMAKTKIIHSIAKQYTAHNELVPIWLNIGDIKGGAE